MTNQEAQEYARIHSVSIRTAFRRNAKINQKQEESKKDPYEHSKGKFV